MDILPYIVIAIVGFIAGLLSGVGGGAGSLLMIPAYTFLGLPAQNAVATMKLTSLGVITGGLTAFRKTDYFRGDVFRVMAPMAFIIGVTTPFVFAAIEARTFQVVLGVIMLLLVPTLFMRKFQPKSPSKNRRRVGYGLYTIILFIQGVFGSGAGSLAFSCFRGCLASQSSKQWPLDALLVRLWDRLYLFRS